MPANASKLKLYRLTITAVAGLLGLLICVLPGPEGLSASGQRLAGVAVVMAILWSTQAWPLAVTSLIPLVAYPLLQIQQAKQVSESYMNATILLYFSGFAIAIGVERWGLHHRLALRCLLLLGSSPRRIVLAFMLATGVMSMWISNTAATLLMLPIAIAVLSTVSSTQSPSPPAERSNKISTRGEGQLAVALLLGIAYAASIGGMCTLIGTPTNGVYAGYWTTAAANPEQAAAYRVSSGQWFLMFAPISATLMTFTWLLLCLRLPKQLSLGTEFRAIIERRFRKLGKPSVGELRMLGLFLLVATLWLTRASLEVGSVTLVGWEAGLDRLISWFNPGFEYAGWLHDSTAGLFVMFLMFVIPAGGDQHEDRVFLMDWETIEAKTPWGILLLFGGGFALASACTTTGLSAWMGQQIGQQIANLGDVTKIASVTTLVIFLTEFTSNTATISTLLPILDETAVSLQLDPRLLMLPATIAASCAFMMPIATPPNAIVFSSRMLKVSQMLFWGLWLNLTAILIITVFTSLWVLKITQIGG